MSLRRNFSRKGKFFLFVLYVLWNVLEKVYEEENLLENLIFMLLQPRIMSHYHTSHNQPENCLWTDKYQPQNAKQVSI